MNKRAKGMRHERELQKLLEDAGYVVYRPAWGRVSTVKDVFGKFDIIAVLKREYDEKKADKVARGFGIVFIQVKSNPTDFYKARKEVEAFVDSTSVLGFNDEVAVGVALRKKGGLWRVWLISTSGVWDFEFDRKEVLSGAKR